VPEGHPEGQLLSHVPRGRHQSDSGQEGPLGEAYSKTGTSETGRRLDDGEQDGRDRPAEPTNQSATFALMGIDDYSHHERDNDSRLVLGQQKGSRHLGDHVTGVEERDTGALNVSTQLPRRREVY